MSDSTRFNRRHFLLGSAAVAATAMSGVRFETALADDFPSGNIDVVVPTREGGGSKSGYSVASRRNALRN